jgi:pantetheine-phosphate adenylyltransferase
LTDPFGPTINDENIDAIIVSEETLKTTEIINEKRKEKGFHPLAVEMCPIMAPVNHLTSLKTLENKFSSTQLRSHILAKNGFTTLQYTQYESVW